MILVVDASVTIAAMAIDEDSAYADATVHAFATDRCLVPALWHWEIANSLLVLERRGRLASADRAYADVFKKFLVDVDTDDTVSRRLGELELARRHNLTVYDAAYLGLATRRRAPLATLDARLARAAEAEGCFFRP